MFRNSFQEEPVPATTKDSKLNAVFSKLTGVFPRAEDFNQTNNKIMSSDIIESVLVDTPVPVTSSGMYNKIFSLIYLVENLVSWIWTYNFQFFFFF